jgi:hypothetical protein
MYLGDIVAWHIYGSGGQTDHHHVVFEGNAFNVDGRNLDTFSVYPGTGQSLIMIPDQNGKRCFYHVSFIIYFRKTESEILN